MKQLFKQPAKLIYPVFSVTFDNVLGLLELGVCAASFVLKTRLNLLHPLSQSIDHSLCDIIYIATFVGQSVRSFFDIAFVGSLQLSVLFIHLQ